MQASLLCPIAQGDQPYQHRFYDVILAGCVPLLFAYPVQEAKDAAKGKEPPSTLVSCEAWSWEPGSGFAHRNKPCVDLRSSCAENAYPFTGPKGVPYFNLTERVDAEVPLTLTVTLTPALTVTLTLNITLTLTLTLLQADGASGRGEVLSTNLARCLAWISLAFPCPPLPCLTLPCPTLPCLALPYLIKVLSTRPPPKNGSSTHQVTWKPLSAQLAALDHQRLLAKREALQQYRQWFAYDWSGGTFDAFSATMQEVCLLLHTEGRWRMSESRVARTAPRTAF